MQTYIVQKGDTLYGISKQFGVSVNDLILQNNIVNNNIAVGQVLSIPTIGTTVLYIVVRGDTLYSIASKYGVSVVELMQINNLNSSVLNVGQQLRIPINSSSSNVIYYTVVKGDTLYGIANRFNVTVEALKKANNLPNTSLSIGQQLKIPNSLPIENPNDYLIYIVKSGDTLYGIASKYGMTVEQLKSLNHLTSNNLYIGQPLQINDTFSSNILIGSSCYGEGYVEVKYITYVVKPGDNLYKIAKTYGTSVNNLIALNGLTSNNLSIGQILKIKEDV